jgi:hypothetical protein
MPTDRSIRLFLSESSLARDYYLSVYREVHLFLECGLFASLEIWLFVVVRAVVYRSFVEILPILSVSIPLHLTIQHCVLF